jgi:hypothetical protein
VCWAYLRICSDSTSPTFIHNSESHTVSSLFQNRLKLFVYSRSCFALECTASREEDRNEQAQTLEDVLLWLQMWRTIVSYFPKGWASEEVLTLLALLVQKYKYWRRRRC